MRVGLVCCSIMRTATRYILVPGPGAVHMRSAGTPDCRPGSLKAHNFLVALACQPAQHKLAKSRACSQPRVAVDTTDGMPEPTAIRPPQRIRMLLCPGCTPPILPAHRISPAQSIIHSGTHPRNCAQNNLPQAPGQAPTANNTPRGASAESRQDAHSKRGVEEDPLLLAVRGQREQGVADGMCACASPQQQIRSQDPTEIARSTCVRQ